MPQASLPATPRTWSAGDLVTVPRLRQDPVNAIAFLLGRPTFAGLQTSGPAYSPGSDTGAGLQAELIDNWSGHVTVNSGSASSSQYWAPVPGYYLCRFTVPFSYTSGTQAPFAAGLQGIDNGIAFGPTRGPVTLCGSTHPPLAQVTDLVLMQNAGPPGGSGDWVQFDLWQNSSGSVSLVYNGDAMPYASARWVCSVTGASSLPVPPLTAVPSPITSAWCNADIRDTIKQLIYPPICRAVYAPGSATLASTTFPGSSTAPLNGVTADNYGGFNGGTSTYTAPVGGRYLIVGQVNFAASTASGAYCAGLTVNAGGTTQWGDRVNKVSDTSGGGAGVLKRLRLNAGDTVRLTASQNTGTTLTYSTASVTPTRMIIVWEGI